MVQARRKSPGKKSARGKSGGGLAGIFILLIGICIGSLATILWQGTQTDNEEGGIGAGIRRMVESARQAPPAGSQEKSDKGETRTDKPSTDFSFFTVLPEIEVVAPSTETAAATTPPAAKPQKPAKAEQPPAADDSSYMLQAGSYRRLADADRLKATLALNGLVSTIQKVSIQGRGDFYRVRLGPYPTYRAMEKADEQLSRAGIEALRLKMFKSG